MASDVSIANSALNKVGAKTITSLTDGTPSANFINDIFVEARRDLLRVHPWNFAMKLVKLPRLSETPGFSWTYGYSLPGDWVKTIGVFDNDAGTGTMAYEMGNMGDNQVVLSSAEDIYLRYVADIADANVMTADFRETFAFRLAKAAALGLTDSNSLYQLMSNSFDLQLLKARTSDGLENPSKGFPRGSWITKRFRSYSH